MRYALVVVPAVVVFTGVVLVTGIILLLIVVPLEQRLGEQVADRVHPGPTHAHVVGALEGLVIAELPIHRSLLSRPTPRELRLREDLWPNVVMGAGAPPASPARR